MSVLYCTMVCFRMIFISLIPNEYYPCEHKLLFFLEITLMSTTFMFYDPTLHVPEHRQSVGFNYLFCHTSLGFML